MDQHFTRLLTFLSPEDLEEAGRRYVLLHQKLVGYFQICGVADPKAAADEAIDRAARRIAEGAEVPDINKFSLGIARFIIKEDRRINTRESAAFLQFLQIEHVSEDELDRFRLMESCFSQLPSYDRDLLNSYCAAPRGQARANYRRELAERLHYTVSALRIRVTRLRRELDNCVKELSQSQW